MTTATTYKAADNAAFHLDPRAKLEILGAILLAMFLFALDQTVVGTALPRIVTDLRGNELYTWAVTIYLLTATISGPIYGKLSDLFGRRPIVIWAVGLFLVSSVLAGASQEMWQFILFRGLQGLGGGAVFPIALAVVADLYEPAERGKYLGLFGAVFGVVLARGPRDRRVHHRHVQLALDLLRERARRRDLAGHPVAPPAGHQAAGSRPPHRLHRRRRCSPRRSRRSSSASPTRRPGSGPIRPSGASSPSASSWPSCSSGSRAASPSRSSRSTSSASRTFSISVVAMFLAAFGFFTAVIFLPRWFQTVGGASATESGYNLLPLLGGLIISAIASGQIVARTGRYKVLIFSSLMLLAVGLTLLTNLRADTDRPMLWLWMVVAGIGIGPSFAVFTLIVQNSVSPDRIGAATSGLTFFQQIGGTVGLTIAGTMFADRLAAEIPSQLIQAGVPQQLVTQFAAGGAGGGSLDVTGTGDLGQRILASLPEAARATVEPLIPGIVHAHPPGLLDRPCVHVHRGHRRRDPGGRAGPVPARGAHARDRPGRGGRAVQARARRVRWRAA